MGNSAKWFKSLIPLKKPQQKDQEKVAEKSVKKWRLWRSSSEGYVPSTKGNVKKGQAEAMDEAFSAAMATVVRAPPKDFRAIKQEWAAIRIQTAFRALLARRALRALRAVVRIQAIFRGRQVRKQAAVTLRCMQALVRVQARVRARSVGISPEEEEMQKLQDPVKAAEGGWCDSPGTVEEVKAKLQMRQEGAIKRERAIAYALTQQQLRMSASPKPKTKKPVMTPVKAHRLDRGSPGRSWLDRWMANKPWENRLMEETHSDIITRTPFSRKSDDNIVGFYSHSTEDEPVKVRRNNVSTRISARPPTTVNQISRSSSDPSTESLYDETTPASTSSTSSSSQTQNTVEDAGIQKRSYMNLTEATKAKQRSCKNENMQKHFREDLSFQSKSGALSSGDTRSNADSDSFVDPCKDLYPPEYLGRQRWARISRRTLY